MRLTPRRLTAFIAAAGLVVGSFVVAAGSASAAVPAPPPSGVIGFGINYGYAVHWSAPQDPLSAVTRYDVLLNLATSPDLTPPLRIAHVASTERSTSFTGLTPGTVYVASVVAEYGGVLSAPAYGAASPAYEPVGRPGSVRVRVGKKALTASWSAPATSHLTGAMLRYVVHTTPSLGSDVWVSPSSHALRLSGLTNGRRYVVTVTAVAGDVGGSAAAAGTPIGSPARPTHLKRAWKKHGVVRLSWRGAKSTTAAPVTGYYVYVNGKRAATLSRTARSWTGKHEKKGHKYSFSVRARNSVGVSTVSSIARKKRPIS